MSHHCAVEQFWWAGHSWEDSPLDNVFFIFRGWLSLRFAGVDLKNFIFTFCKSERSVTLFYIFTLSISLQMFLMSCLLRWFSPLHAFIFWVILWFYRSFSNPAWPWCLKLNSDVQKIRNFLLGGFVFGSPFSLTKWNHHFKTAFCICAC